MLHKITIYRKSYGYLKDEFDIASYDEASVLGHEYAGYQNEASNNEDRKNIAIKNLFLNVDPIYESSLISWDDVVKVVKSDELNAAILFEDVIDQDEDGHDIIAYRGDLHVYEGTYGEALNGIYRYYPEAFRVKDDLNPCFREKIVIDSEDVKFGFSKFALPFDIDKRQLDIYPMSKYEPTPMALYEAMKNIKTYIGADYFRYVETLGCAEFVRQEHPLRIEAWEGQSGAKYWHLYETQYQNPESGEYPEIWMSAPGQKVASLDISSSGKCKTYLSRLRDWYLYFFKNNGSSNNNIYDWIKNNQRKGEVEQIKRSYQKPQWFRPYQDRVHTPGSEPECQIWNTVNKYYCNEENKI
jgi:hypothetical protein